MRRILAHKIVFDGREYRMHVAEFSDDGMVRLYPYEQEIYSTEFINGTVEIVRNDDAQSYSVRQLPD